jgi:hypothetical protein
MTSLWAAGRPEYRNSPEDPAPGVPSITAVMEQLNLKRFDQVIEVNAADGWVAAQGRCRWDSLRTFLAERDLVLAPGSSAGQPPDATAEASALTVGAVIAGRQARPLWVDVLTKDGILTRHEGTDLPPDALIVAAALRLTALK